jgi:hypothetical protein
LFVFSLKATQYYKNITKDINFAAAGGKIAQPFHSYRVPELNKNSGFYNIKKVL